MDDFNVLKGFKKEYAIKNFFSKSQWTPPLHFLIFFLKTSKKLLVNCGLDEELAIIREFLFYVKS